MISATAGTACFLWQAVSATRQATSSSTEKVEALDEALYILGLAQRPPRRETMFVHNGLSAVRPRVE